MRSTNSNMYFAYMDLTNLRIISKFRRMKTIEERANLAAWQIYAETFLSEHSVDRVAEIIEETINEQKAVDIDKACEWLKNNLREYGIILFGHWESDFRKAMEE